MEMNLLIPLLFWEYQNRTEYVAEIDLSGGTGEIYILYFYLFQIESNIFFSRKILYILNEINRIDWRKNTCYNLHDMFRILSHGLYQKAKI